MAAGGQYCRYFHHGANYAVISVTGIAALVIAGRIKQGYFGNLMLLVSLGIMIAGVIVFMNWGTTARTFMYTLPVITFILCGTSAVLMVTGRLFGRKAVI